jgi:hypothetical protein
MSAAGGTVTFTVRCKAFPSNGEETVQLPSTTTCMQLKEHYAEKFGFNVGELQVISSKGGKILKDTDVLTPIVTLMVGKQIGGSGQC